MPRSGNSPTALRDKVSQALVAIQTIAPGCSHPRIVDARSGQRTVRVAYIVEVPV